MRPLVFGTKARWATALGALALGAWLLAPDVEDRRDQRSPPTRSAFVAITLL